MIKLDELDQQILHVLKEDSRTSNTAIAKILKTSEGTVRRRIQNLVTTGIIRRFTIEVGVKRPKALILAAVSPSTPTSQIAEEIVNIEEVDALFEVAGPYDITITISGADITSINESIEKIRSLNGVQQTNTLFVLKEW